MKEGGQEDGGRTEVGVDESRLLKLDDLHSNDEAVREIPVTNYLLHLTGRKGRRRK
jgi:hypothetical protein